MIVGDPSVLAIESGIKQAYQNLGLRAWGLFVIHVGGERYGVFAPDATMMANSFDEVGRRLRDRGQHTAPFATEVDATRIAESIEVLYSDQFEGKAIFGLPESEFSELIYTKDLLWAPDGDEAFDDSSYILQFDVQDQVRIVAFRRLEAGIEDLRDVWLESNKYYEVLQQWFEAFQAEWESAPNKILVD